MEEIFGIVERITFYNPTNGFTVLRLKTKEREDLLTVVGSFPLIQGGETMRLKGQWQCSEAHGRQFLMQSFELVIPYDLLGIQKYLGSGLISGIGEEYARRIIEKFGLKTLEVIDQKPEELLTISGIGKKRLEKIKNSWQEQKSIRDLLIFLQKHDITPTYAHKLYKAYGNQAITIIEENPYQLAHEITGIGFKTADLMAEKLGQNKTSSFRIDSGLIYVFFELAKEGHVCSPLHHFIAKAKLILEVDESLIEESIFRLKERGEIIEQIVEEDQEPYVWLRGYFRAETGIADELQRLMTSPSHLRTIDLEKAVDWVEKKLHLFLALEQKEAVKQALSEKVAILTGGPGTGKSTITKAILTIASQLTRHILLAAPTGKAAKRLSEITHRHAQTLHALLQFDFKDNSFKKNRLNPLTCDLIIIDEVSMIDTMLMYNLLQAIPKHASVLFVGDSNQLPSIGPGNVLKDLIDSALIAKTNLVKIFRQAEDSKIITNAHRINEGVFPDLAPAKDFLYFQADDPTVALENILSLTTKMLPEKYHFDPFDDIQVLSPMKRGPIGTENLNQLLQKALNETPEFLLYGGIKFAKGDKVMQIKNNYKKEIFNGDIGRILSIHNEEKSLLVLFDDKEVEYEFSDLDELTLAYAISIHKYQGSEAPCIVVPIHTSHYIMLQRNLLYTAVTRGKNCVALVGSPKAISIAIQNVKSRKRFTALAFHLKNVLEAVLKK